MVHKVDFAQREYRFLYAQIHDALAAACLRQGHSSHLIPSWMVRIVSGDPSLFLLVELSDKYVVMSHCLGVIEQDEHGLIANVIQLETRFRKSSTFVKDMLDFIEVLRSSYPALYRLVVQTTIPRMKHLTKPHGFGIERVILHRELKEHDHLPD